MDVRLQPRTKPGVRFCELAEQHGALAAESAAGHDRDGTFPHELFGAMKESGFMAASVPEEYGGLGVTSTHDLAAGLARLGAADGSVAIAANMHLAFAPLMQWVQRLNREQGDPAVAEGLDLLLGMLGSGLVAMGNQTEVGTDLAHPLLEATKVDGGWLLNGRKTFGTLCEVADLFLVSNRYRRDDGTWGAANAFVFRGAPGQEIKSNWDALGMRASGSHDVVYTDCFVPEAQFFGQGRWGEQTVLGLVLRVGANLPLLAPFLGIAESARDLVVEMARTRTKAPSGRPIAERSGVQHLVAEMDVDLATCRALLERSTLRFDALVLEGPIPSMETMYTLDHDFQCTKLVVNRKAIEVVDRALTVSGGAGYMNAHPLARKYRDVRAGPFMQPYSPNEAHEYIGRIALGLPPDVSA